MFGAGPEAARISSPRTCEVSSDEITLDQERNMDRTLRLVYLEGK